MERVRGDLMHSEEERDEYGARLEAQIISMREEIDRARTAVRKSGSPTRGESLAEDIQDVGEHLKMTKSELEGTLQSAMMMETELTSQNEKQAGKIEALESRLEEMDTEFMQASEMIESQNSEIANKTEEVRRVQEESRMERSQLIEETNEASKRWKEETQRLHDYYSQEMQQQQGNNEMVLENKDKA